MIRLSIPALLAVVASAYSMAWGPNTHRTIGLVAERHLEKSTAQAVYLLLEGESLAEASTWADEIRSSERWECAGPFHHSTIRPGESYRHVPDRGDAIGAIAYFSLLLGDSSRSTGQRADALRFLLHIVGDLHQPLHVGLGCDAGGNDVQVEWMGEATNLHRVWDTLLYRSFNLRFTEFAEIIDTATSEEVAALQNSSPLSWAAESQAALQEVYRCSTLDGCRCLCGDCDGGYSNFGGCEERSCRRVSSAPVKLGGEYRIRNEQLLKDRLLSAGVRLAAILNWSLGESGFPAHYRTFLQHLQLKRDWSSAFRRCPE